MFKYFIIDYKVTSLIHLGFLQFIWKRYRLVFKIENMNYFYGEFLINGNFFIVT